VLTRQPPSPPFAAFAQFYDAYTAHPGYAGWVRGLVRLADAPGRRALDLGCGTGNSTLPLLDLGYSVLGCDASPGMLELARVKTAGRARFAECDAAALPRLGEFDLVLCANDVVNYLLTGDEVQAMLRGVRANLAPGGVLVFDANTLATFRTTFSTSHERVAGGFSFTWSGLGSPDIAPGGTAVAEISVARGDTVLDTSLHTQRHHPHGELVSALRAAGLELAAVLGQHADGRRDLDVDDSRHLKAVYVARRPSATVGEEVS
jgi:SAM-dependent methyltransferase